MMRADMDEGGDMSAILGVDRARTKLTAWLKKIVDNPEIQQTLNFTLYQVADLQLENRVETFAHDFEQPPEVSVEAFLDCAQQDLVTNHSLDKTAYAVRVDGRQDRSTFMLEVPVHTGLVSSPRSDLSPYSHDIAAQTHAQTKDQNSFLIDKVVELSGRNEGLVLTLLARSEAKVERLERTEIQRATQVEKLIDGNVQRNMMLDDHRREQDRKDKFADGFKKMGPPILATMMGPQAAAALAMVSGGAEGGIPGLPGAEGQSGPSDEDLVDRLILSLERSPEKLQAFAQIFEPSDMAIFAELHKNSASRREAAQVEAQNQQAAQPQQPQPQQPSGQSGKTPYSPPPTARYAPPSPPGYVCPPTGYASPSPGYYGRSPHQGGGFRPNT